MTGDPDPATIRRIERAIRRLPRREREIFLAMRIEGLSYAGIAARTGLTVEEVEKLFARALCAVSRHVDRAERRRRWQRR
jgi:RNA polymerase sigma-70 factor (ECF subfamily)